MSELSPEARRLLEAIDGVGSPTQSQRALMRRAIALAMAAPVAGALAAKVGAAANTLGAAQTASGVGAAKAAATALGAAQAGASAGANTFGAAQTASGVGAAQAAATGLGAGQAGASAATAGANTLGAAQTASGVGAAKAAATGLGAAQAGASAASAGASTLGAAQTASGVGAAQAAATEFGAQAGASAAAAASAGANTFSAAQAGANTAGAAQSVAMGAGAANVVGATGQAGAVGVAAASTSLLTAGAWFTWVKLLALGVVSSAVGAAATWQVLPGHAPASGQPSGAPATATAPGSAPGRAAPRETSLVPQLANAKPSAAAVEGLAHRGLNSGSEEPGAVAAPPERVAVDAPGPPHSPPSFDEAVSAPPGPVSGDRERTAEGPRRAPPARLPERAHDGPSRPSTNAVDEAPLGRELGTIAGAVAALDAKRFDEALETVTRYRDTFPTGALITEARVLEVLALCGLGRRDEAQRAAAAIGTNESNNPAVRRLARSCVGASQWDRLPAATQ